MYRRFIATIAATSIAFAGLGAAPAFADARDTARALAAILGIAVVGKIIHDKNKRDRVKHQQVHQPKKHQQKKHKANKVPRYQDPVPRPLPKRVKKRLLPSQCLRSYKTYEGRVRMFAKRCLKNNYNFTRSLPRHCEYVFDTPRGDRRGFEARCLRREGYRLAQR